MNLRKFLLCLVIAVLPIIAFCQQSDSSSVRNTAMAYIEAWYSGNSKKMEGAIHPDLIKRIIRVVDTATNSQIITNATADALIRNTAVGLGKSMKGAKASSDYSLLDMSTSIAIVRIKTLDFVDHLQLGKINGQWKIINILWSKNE